MTEKFNVIPCGQCGQKYAGKGHVISNDAGQAINVVCPPCKKLGTETHPEVQDPVTGLDAHGHWHDALTLIEQYHDHRAVSDMLNTMTRPELERTMFALTGLIHHRATMFEEIEDTQEWAATFRETYQELIENPSSDNNEE